MKEGTWGRNGGEREREREKMSVDARKCHLSILPRITGATMKNVFKKRIIVAALD